MVLPAVAATVRALRTVARGSARRWGGEARYPRRDGHWGTWSWAVGVSLSGCTQDSAHAQPVSE
jgi:hypothetical protein